ncbi:MAG: LysE family transporter [Tenacibaculum sp.]|nr:LysE family transporter [Tenacibaculum sp.]
MDIYDFKNAFIFGVFMAFMIGPVFFMLLQTSILRGVKAALSFDLGVILGDIAFMTLAYYGSRSILEKIKNDPRLFIAGGLILLVYGLITYFNNKKNREESDEIEISNNNNYFRLFLKGFFLNIINVGVLGSWLGVIIVIGPALDMNPQYILWYLTTILIGYFITDICKIFLAKRLKKKLTPTVIYNIKKWMSIFIIVFGAILIIKTFIPKEQINTFIQNF